MEAGLYLCGCYVASDSVKSVNQDTGEVKHRSVISVAYGMQSSRVYMSGLLDLSAYKLGDPILIKCRAYNGKNGYGFSDGEIVD